MKVLCLDATNNYTVQSIYPNSSNYTESYRSDGAVEAQWNQIIDQDHPPATIYSTFFSNTQEIITVDDSVQVAVGDSALVEPFLDLLIAQLKQRKLHELNVAWQTASVSDFTVSSTGNSYASTSDSLLAITMQAVDLLMFPEDYPDTNPILWQTTNNGVQPHTAAQFKDVCRALREHLRDNMAKLWSLQAQLNQATTIDQVKAIHW